MTEDTSPAITDVIAERARQDAKWGEQNHPNGTGPQSTPVAEIVRGPGHEIINRHFALGLSFNAKAATDEHARAGSVTWADILLEEVFEALAESNPAKLRTELVQVAAVATQWVEAIDRHLEQMAKLHKQHVTVEEEWPLDCIEGDCEHRDEDGQPEDLSVCPPIPMEVCIGCMVTGGSARIPSTGGMRRCRRGRASTEAANGEQGSAAAHAGALPEDEDPRRSTSAGGAARVRSVGGLGVRCIPRACHGHRGSGRGVRPHA